MAKVVFFSVAILSLTISHVLGSHNASSGETYTHKTVLKENVYEIFWKYDSETITFEVEVATTGWVGFGFSPNGGMAGSDIVIGGVKANGESYFTDRHATGMSTPIVDASSDYQLLHSSENQSKTTLRFKRKLDTCDNDDMLINSDTFRIIWSYGADDNVAYHNSNRGVKSFLLLSNVTPKPTMPSDVITWDFLVKDVKVPAKDTVYWCKGFDVPTLPSKHHVLKYAPVITAGNEALVHHIIIYACYGDVNTTGAHLRNEESCGLMPNKLQGSCGSTYVAWAIGGEDFYYPPNVGLPVGDDLQPKFLLLELHYDNPSMSANLIDSSGIRLTLSPTLRQYDAGLLEFGHVVYPSQAIPPNTDSFTTYGYCHGDCTREGLATQPNGIKIFAGVLHSHLLGRKMRLRHIRKGIEQEPIFEDSNYDFNYQEMIVRRSEKVILPGDDVQMECQLDSKKKSTMTYGGLATTDEMCLSFVLYYPRVNLTKCASNRYSFVPFFAAKGYQSAWNSELFQMVITNGKYKGFTEIQALNNMTWTQADVSLLENTSKKDVYAMTCAASGDQEFSAANRPYGTYSAGLNITVPYSYSKRTCNPINGPTDGSPSSAKSTYVINLSLLTFLVAAFSF